MECHEARELIGPLADGELVQDDRRMVEQHLASCSACSHALNEARGLADDIRHAGRFTAPAGLETRIRRTLGREERASLAASLEEAAVSRKTWAIFTSPWALTVSHGGAALLGGLIVAIALMLRPWTPSSADLLAGEVLSAHVRALMAEQFQKVASSDMHTVKPWFAGKLDYSPTVVDLGSDGFPLISGRIDYLQGRTVAALEYAKGRHKISVFVLPNGQAAPAESIDQSDNGYNVVSWREPDFTYWAVSDMNAQDLRTFVRLLRHHVETLKPSHAPL